MAQMELFKVDDLSPEVKRIPLDEIREGICEVSRSMVQSVERFGLVQPPVVHREDGHYVVDVGRRRIKALREAGQTEVMCLVLEGVNSTKSAVLALIENMHRKPNPVSEYRQIQVLLESGMTQGEIGTYLGISQAAVSQRLGLSKLLPEWWEELVEAGILYSQGTEIAKLTPDQQQKLYRQHVEEGGITSKDIQSVKGAAREEVLARLPSDLFGDEDCHPRSQSPAVTVIGQIGGFLIQRGEERYTLSPSELWEAVLEHVGIEPDYGRPVPVDEGGGPPMCDEEPYVDDSMQMSEAAEAEDAAERDIFPPESYVPF